MNFKTSDTALASYLITVGFLPSAIDYSSPPRFTIVFANSAESIQTHASQYVAGLAKVDPATFYRVIRKLTRIFRNRQQWGDD